MATYPVSSTAVRESVSLDEDDLSDVEDEVFIRDGRNSYKLAEDRGVKRPLMAPRRKVTSKPDFGCRLRNRPCRVFCVPCCYAFAALTIFLGFIVLVIILVSLFPLPIDKFKSWIVSKADNNKTSAKVIPCTDLTVSDVWSFNLPKLASESALRSLDVNSDGIDDIVFGFGLGEDVELPQQWFCTMFLGVKPPCQGGVIALDGSTGQPLWRRWLSHTVFTIFCTTDLTGDKINDCLASGKGGVLSAINGRDGTIIWEFLNNKTSLVMDIYSGSFVPDQDGDGVLDIVAAHTLQTGGNRMGFLLLISGKNGNELSRVSTPNSTETLYAPQLFVRANGINTILFGTGSQSSPGALYMVQLQDILQKKMEPVILYEDKYKGVLSPVILVDLNGDDHDDIVSAMFNTTIVAIDGKTLRQLWNYTVNNSEALSSPTPGYFTSDNVTDFLIKYQTGPGFPVYYYSQTIIIDGKTGKPIYNRPIIDSVGTQMGGLTISMENHGHDMFVYWIGDCKNFEGRQDTFSFGQENNVWQKSRADLCNLRFNTSKVTKLYSLNQYNEPPGILLYTSENRTSLEYNGTKTPLEEVRLYLQENPDFDFGSRSSNPPQNHDEDNINPDSKTGKSVTTGSNFRHRDDDQGLVKKFNRNRINKPQIQNEEKYDYDLADVPPDYDLLDPPQLDYSDSYSDVSDRMNRKQFTSTNRDPRSKISLDNNTQQQNEEEADKNDFKTKKKNLSEIHGPNDYDNVHKARNRLLHDLNDLPSEILRETYLKNQERLRNNKFEQRDLRYRESELNKTDDSNDTKELKLDEFPESLWDLESEKELEDRENGYWRGKRDAVTVPFGVSRITSTGILLKSLPEPKSQNSIDLVFLTYWTLPKPGAYIILDKDLECIRQKFVQASSPTDKYYNLEKETKQDLFTKLCLEERGVFMNLRETVSSKDNNNNLRKSYLNLISQLTLGQMTVYRLKIECKCQVLKPNERCTKILGPNKQVWSSFMGKLGDGIFKKH